MATEVTFINELERRFRDFIAFAHSNGNAESKRVPYQWQIRLLHNIVQEGRWPDQIVAPTASGKTCVIDIHVFLNAMAGLQQEGLLPELSNSHSLQSLPRRLALTVNRRSLVDDQYEEAVSLRDRIMHDPQDDSSRYDSMQEFRLGLQCRSGLVKGEQLQVQDDREGLHTLMTVELRGGSGSSADRREWRYYPQTCAVICATPDMFGSRLLFRGYGTSRSMRPMEAGELAYDTVLIADEAHLSRQLVETARQIPRIESMAGDAVRSCVPTLQVVETTATPQSEEKQGNKANAGLVSVGVEASDFDNDAALAKRLCTPKHLVLEQTAQKTNELADQIVDRCEVLILEYESRQYDDASLPVLGCVLNTVDMARRVKSNLEKRLKKAGITRPVKAYVGPMRAYEKTGVAQELSTISDAGLASSDSDSIASHPCCVIGTQTLEVGVDVDFTDMVTELAPASAIVQRAGRVNRQGKRDSARLFVYGASEQLAENEQQKMARPYDAEELREASAWLRAISDDQGDIDCCAWAIRIAGEEGNPVPASKPQRLLYQRLEYWDVENLSNTDEQLFADCSIRELQQTPSDIELWVRDSLDNANIPDSVGVIVRDLPWDDAVASALLEMIPPLDQEIMPVRNRMQLTGKKDSLQAYLAQSQILVKDSKTQASVIHKSRVFRYRASESENHRIQVFIDEKAFAQAAPPLVAAGDVFIVDTYAQLFDELPSFSPESGENACSVLMKRNDNEEPDVAVYRVDRLSATSLAKAAESLIQREQAIREHMETGSSELGSSVDELREVVPDLIREFLEQEQAVSGGTQSHQSEKVDVHLDIADWFADEGVFETSKKIVATGEDLVESHDYSDWWIVLRNNASLTGDAASQEISTSNRVLLQGEHGHQQHVADRAVELAKQLHLSDELVSALQLAGQYHDEGKKDERFQRLLRRGRKQGNTEYLAKSGFSSWKGERQFRSENRLTGWRHEQRSVAEFDIAIRSGSIEGSVFSDCNMDLVFRLIGTSHGHGRSTFNQASASLLPQASEEYDPQLIRSAQEFFDNGLWESVIAKTAQEYGFWGVSYLEALLRAADITVSKEGR